MKLRSGTIVFLLGILFFNSLSSMPSLGWFFLLPVMILFSLRFQFMRWICVCAFGFLWAMIRAEIILSEQLENNLEGEIITITGKVDSLTEIKHKGIRFIFKIEHMSMNNGKNLEVTNLKARLNWYYQAGNIKPGEKWQLQVKLKKPHGFMNPGGFDYEGWLFQHRIRAVGYVLNSPNNYLLRESSLFSLHRMRYELRNTIVEKLSDHPFRGLVIALGLGDRSNITADQNKLLIQTGTSHLLAISGLHVGLVSGMVFFLGLRLFGLSGFIFHRISPVSMAAILSIVAAGIYSALAGFSIPTQRAFIMVTIIFAVMISNRRYPVTYVLALALLFVLILDPFSAISNSFWLTFSAVSILYFGMTCRVYSKKVYWHWSRTQFNLTLGLLPVLAFWFQQFPVTGFPANLIAIPWISFCVIPFVLSGILFQGISTTLGNALLGYSAELLKMLWPLLEMISSLSAPVTVMGMPNLTVALSAMFGISILLLPSGFPARWIGLIWLLPIFITTSDKPGKEEIWFTLLDVGQGLSSVVQTRNHVLVFDTGARFTERFNAGEAVVLPFLKKSRIYSIDRIIISHGDNDHIGGLSPLLLQYTDTSVVTSIPEKINHHIIESCIAGKKWIWDGVKFEILSPAYPIQMDNNNQSCVLKIGQGEHSILLTGDIENRVEKKLLNTRKKDLSARILVAPHHGSKTSSSSAFIDAVAPEYVLFPVGYRNRFNLPNQDIMERYQLRGIKMLDSPRHGAISIEFNKKGMSINSYRQSARKFWHNLN